MGLGLFGFFQGLKLFGSWVCAGFQIVEGWLVCFGAEGCVGLGLFGS